MITTNELTPLTAKAVQPLTRFSRFANQQMFRNVDGRPFFGTYVPPAFPVSPTDTYYTIREGQEHRLDLVSYLFYRTPELYWIILLANDILSPFDGVNIGDILRIPSLSTVTTYLAQV